LKLSLLSSKAKITQLNKNKTKKTNIIGEIYQQERTVVAVAESRYCCWVPKSNPSKEKERKTKKFHPSPLQSLIGEGLNLEPKS
jgi:hypothetical protein